LAFGLLALVAVTILAAFGTAQWQIIGSGTLLIAVIVVVLLALGALLITLGITAITRRRTRILSWTGRLVRLLLVLVTLVVAVASAMIGSQWHTSTAPILGADGKILPGSIATLEQVTLGGSQQWITIRGKNVHHPVLLYLAGSSGASELSYTRSFLGALEDQFVVVNWDQPGAGKSYDAVPIATLTPQRYVSDAHQLVQLVRTRFHQDKLYLLGESWGTIPGTLLVQQYPDLFSAYIGIGQIVNPTENEVMGYQFALQYATGRGDTATVQALRHNGPPPYMGSDMLANYQAYITVLGAYMAQHARLTNTGVQEALFAPEYGLLDKVNLLRSQSSSLWTILHPQLAHLDFTRSAARLEVPVYFLEGRWDASEMPSLVEQYYRVLQAPHKELIWFGTSAHPPMQYEPNQVAAVLVNQVLKQTWPGR
jgi:pimeloyl-ACP methyl ester carboxylesterase